MPTYILRKKGKKVKKKKKKMERPTTARPRSNTDPNLRRSLLQNKATSHGNLLDLCKTDSSSECMGKEFIGKLTRQRSLSSFDQDIIMEAKGLLREYPITPTVERSIR